MRGAEDVRALGHEVHAAEDDEIGGVFAGGVLGELQGIAGVVGELDDFIALVVVAEDDEAFAERGFGRGDAEVHLGVREPQEGLRQRLPLVEPCALEFGEHLDGCQCLRHACAACEIFLNLQKLKMPNPVWALCAPGYRRTGT